MMVKIGNVECEMLTDQLHTRIILVKDGEFGSADQIGNELLRICETLTQESQS